MFDPFATPHYIDTSGPDSLWLHSLRAQRKLKESRDTWRAWALFLAMTLFVLIGALVLG